jgi:hypothetical protein
MKSEKQNPVVYKRDKNKVEISGDPKDIKGLMWLDMITSKLWIVLVIVLLFTVPKASFVPLLWEWIKKQTPFLILFVVVAGWLQMLLSG